MWPPRCRIFTLASQTSASECNQKHSRVLLSTVGVSWSCASWNGGAAACDVHRPPRSQVNFSRF